MALMNSVGSSLYNQDPQQNQYLTGNASTDPNANTNWMSKTPDSNSPYRNDFTPSGNISETQPNPPSQVQNGTMLGAIAAGNVGQYMPQGYDMGKWNDPNKHDPKYDIGRVLSKYPPSPAGLQAAAPELAKLGFRVIGDDKIVGADGFPIDVGQGFSGGMQNGTPMNWWFNPSNPGEWNQQGMNNQSMLAQQMSQDPFANNNLMNQIWQAMQAQKQISGNQQFNPTGGMIPSQQPTPDANGYFGGWQDETGLRHSGNEPGKSYLL